MGRYKREQHYSEGVKVLKRGQKSPEAAWRFLHNNTNLRGVLYAQYLKSGMSMVQLGAAAGISGISRIHGYFRGAGNNKLNELQIVRLCDVLKVEIDLEIKIVS
jgi:hypothetical protein